MRIKIHIRLKDNGGCCAYKSLSFRKFKSNERLKQRTINSYCSIIDQLNNKLATTCIYQPKTGMFYWEKYCQDQTIDQIVIELHRIYKITNGHDLVMRMAPLVTMINMVPLIPASSLAKWVSLKEQYGTDQGYSTLCQRLKIVSAETMVTAKMIPEWTELLPKLEKISVSKSMDSRLRILATIYKYGYVLRIASIYLTNFKKQHDAHNYLDINTGEWIILHNKVRVQSFSIPNALLTEIKEIVTGNEVFRNGWLLPKQNGQPYGANSGICQLTPWIKLCLPDCVQCRKSFETWHWYKSGCNLEKVEKMSTILDHTKTTAIVHYTPPYGQYLEVIR